MDLEGIILSEVSQTEKDKYCMIYVGGIFKKKTTRDFPCGAVVKNPPANAGDTGLSPGPRRSHMPQSDKARAPQLLNLRSRACEPQLLKPVL